MGMFSFLMGGSSSSGCEIDPIFPFNINSKTFIENDVLSTYTKILTDTAERTQGLNSEQEKVLWDNFTAASGTEGLITLIAKAMAEKNEICLVYSESLKVLRPADDKEKEQIIADYKKQNESKIGIWISFKCYKRTDMLKVYSELEYCILASLHKTVNISKAVQIKVNELRQSTGLADASVAINQAKEIASALRSGKDCLLDSQDTIENAAPDISPTEKAIEFFDAKRAFVLDLPLSYISGMQTPGIGSTGEADMRAVERGLKHYFVSVLQPIVEELFRTKVVFKSQDFKQLSTGIELLKAFSLVGDENLSRKSKQDIIARVFDIDPKEEQKALEDEEKKRQDEQAEFEKQNKNSVDDDSDEDDDGDQNIKSKFGKNK